MPQVVAIIPARGGSKGIPGKNIRAFCGKPLLAWSIEQALAAKHVKSVWVTSDCQEILSLAKQCGANTIVRPEEISGDLASSESAWLHALDILEKQAVKIDVLLAIQATSPVREAKDFDAAIEKFNNEKLNSLFSATELTDFLIWEKSGDNKLKSINYDYRLRGRRQDRASQYVENGSFYLCQPELMRKEKNRLGERMGLYLMPFWKSFEIDNIEDWDLCECLMQHYLGSSNE